MIEILSLWAKNIGVTFVIVSILEMILPNNKTKKYIRMVLGIFVLLNIISPLIQNKDKFKFNEINLSKYESTETTVIDQTTMDERIKELSEHELEKDIKNNLKEEGYIVTKCKVTISDDENRDINKIKTEIEKIKEIDTKIEKDESTEKTNEFKKVTSEDIKKVKKILVEEYEVNEKCLEIN